MPKDQFTKWVACWGNATSITDRKECTYAKDLTLRYPVRMCFPGSRLRFHFSNLTGTEDVTISEAYVVNRSRDADVDCADKDFRKNAGCDRAAGVDCDADGGRPQAITFSGKKQGTIPAGAEILSDEIPLDVTAGDTVEISLYFADYTQMNAGTLVTGPRSGGAFAYGNFALARELPAELSRKTNWHYFLNTVDILTEAKNRALVCFGDSITAQDWPDYLAIRCEREGFGNVSIIRRAVSGTRILREYSCITYAAYGLKGATRFPIELNVAGAEAVIVQHGINDIIHPVGVDVNRFRPWSDMPTVKDLEDGVRDLYIAHARKLGLKIYSGTLLPIYGWRTYNADRETIRDAFNEWLRNAPEFDGCVDFEEAVREKNQSAGEDFANGTAADRTAAADKTAPANRTTAADKTAPANRTAAADKTAPAATPQNKTPAKFAAGFDSGDHLHPSAKAYEAMAECVPAELLK